MATRFMMHHCLRAEGRATVIEIPATSFLEVAHKVLTDNGTYDIIDVAPLVLEAYQPENQKWIVARTLTDLMASRKLRVVKAPKVEQPPPVTRSAPQQPPPLLGAMASPPVPFPNGYGVSQPGLPQSGFYPAPTGGSMPLSPNLPVPPPQLLAPGGYGHSASHVKRPREQQEPHQQDRAHDLQQQRKRVDAAAPAPAPPVPSYGSQSYGVLSRWERDSKGEFGGFIQPDGTHGRFASAFVHIADNPGLCQARRGDRVRYTAMPNPRKAGQMKALQAQVVPRDEGAPVAGAPHQQQLPQGARKRGQLRRWERDTHGKLCGFIQAEGTHFADDRVFVHIDDNPKLAAAQAGACVSYSAVPNYAKNGQLRAVQAEVEASSQQEDAKSTTADGKDPTVKRGTLSRWERDANGLLSGFVQPEGSYFHSDSAFVHISQNPGLASAKTGDRVRYTAIPNPKKAGQMRVVDAQVDNDVTENHPQTSTGNKPAEQTNPAANKPAAPNSADPHSRRGLLKKWEPNASGVLSGFIQPEGTYFNEDFAFVHIGDNPGLAAAKVGDVVCYSAVHNPAKPGQLRAVGAQIEGSNATEKAAGGEENATLPQDGRGSQVLAPPKNAIPMCGVLRRWERDENGLACGFIQPDGMNVAKLYHFVHLNENPGLASASIGDKVRYAAVPNPANMSQLRAIQAQLDVSALE